MRKPTYIVKLKPKEQSKLDKLVHQGKASARVINRARILLYSHHGKNIHHQRTDRTQAHILVCFLALAMWRALQQWMSGCGLGTAPRELLERMRNIHSIDILLPTREKMIRLRAITTAPEELKILLQRLNLPLPNRSKVIENVVQTLTL